MSDVLVLLVFVLVVILLAALCARFWVQREIGQLRTDLAATPGNRVATPNAPARPPLDPETRAGIRRGVMKDFGLSPDAADDFLERCEETFS